LGPEIGLAGFEERWIRTRAAGPGIPILGRAELDALPSGSFDMVTCIEVLEHTVEPLEVLRNIRRLLKTGGLFFLTTGNARPYRRNLLQWRYVYPDVHISYYEPDSLRRALTLTGFRPVRRGYIPGYTDIIRFKCLKTAGVHKRSLWERALPWALIGRLLDWRMGITEHPVGIAAEPET
jgi:SAM-dependent methyltransferase